MRKDLWIGAMTAMVVHSGVVLYSLFQPLRALHKPAAELPLVLTTFTPPPEIVEPPEEIPEEQIKVQQIAPPSLQDSLSPIIKTPFVEPIHPNPPSNDGPPITKIPLESAIGPVGGPGVWESIDLSQLPVATSTPNPQYPFSLRQAGIEGQAIVDFIVDEHGVVTRPFALEGTQAEFGRAAVEGLRRWHFRPGIKDGHAVKTHMQIPIQFSLQK